jgi:signal transduction histidine kinase
VAPDQVRAYVRTRNPLIRQLLKETAPNDQVINALGFVGSTQVAVQLKNGEWLTARMARQTEQEAWLRTIFFSFIGATLVLTPLGLLFARRLASPIGEFAEAADQLGRNADAPLLEEKGPRELRSAVRAFNTMQERIRKFVEGRTLMMAAISHDLRTPLQRLRFRIDSLDETTRNAMLADIQEMEAMIGSTLAFASDEAAPGARQTLDLGALVSSVCDEAADAGGATQCSVSERVVVQGDPVRLKRALSNLVYNATKYAGGAEVRVGHEMGAAVVEVADRGPGIPEDRLEEMFQPFRRLEPSRSRATGGAGLGLSIARTIARAHGGDVTLSPRPGGGLTARLALPA